VREAARLHSFPDWFQFHITKWHALREIGNAVPPRLAAVVGRTIVAALEASPSPPDRELQLGADTLLQMSLVEAARYYKYDEDLLPYDVRRQSSVP
jgi:DNA (cytosine-5)-methyltransferase 1